MPGLAAMEPLAALASMQAINLAVRNAVFAIGFFGALVLSVAVALHALVRRDAPAGRFALSAALIYLIGAFGVTSAFNVPLNGEIAPLDPARPENAQAMISYIAEWTLWNHVRTLASLASFVLLLLSLRAGRGGAWSGNDPRRGGPPHNPCLLGAVEKVLWSEFGCTHAFEIHSPLEGSGIPRGDTR